MRSALRSTLVGLLVAVGGPMLMYVGFISLLGVSSFEARMIYQHRATVDARDLNVPEQVGYSHRQVIPFNIATLDGLKLHAWHILPIGLYYKHIADLQNGEGGLQDIEQTLNFRLLRDDQEARLVLHCHGSRGDLGWSWRPDNHRALAAAAPDKIHVLAFDYRGFGLSEGSPTETGLQTDALSVFKWATDVAKIPPERIAIFGQSLGAGVAISLARELALRNISVAGIITEGGFTDVPTLCTTYRVAGFLPVAMPLVKFPVLMNYFVSRLINTWENKGRLVDYIQASERYHIQLIHAEDDPIVPLSHCDELFRHAVNATASNQLGLEKFDREKTASKTELGQVGFITEWTTPKGLIRQEVFRFGLHDKILSFPLNGLAVLRAFQSVDPSFAA
ncbi:Alpha/Beta hydrolase protein [Camillea tinctor]|nr:Alpha/Beta hydrolase protein [Camillea tinctor]